MLNWKQKEDTFHWCIQRLGVVALYLSLGALLWVAMLPPVWAITFDTSAAGTTPVSFQGHCYRDSTEAAHAVLLSYPRFTALWSPIASAIGVAAESPTSSSVLVVHSGYVSVPTDVLFEGGGGISYTQHVELPDCSAVGVDYTLHDMLLVAYVFIMWALGYLTGILLV